MQPIKVRPARTDEADQLSALCRRSKAHWGYDDAFLLASKVALTVSPARVAEGRIVVAENAQGDLLGVAAANLLEDDVFDLSLLFVEPSAIRTGIGEKLFQAIVAHIAREGAMRLRIESDPNAEKFYLRLGAQRIGETPSGSIPGRMLPLLEYVINATRA